jgi:hypothetical protein
VRKALVLVCVLACAPKTDWKERTGPGFAVQGWRDALILERPIAKGTVMNVYEYGDGTVASMQVDVTALPPDRDALKAIVAMRDFYAKDAVIAREDNVAMGDALGADLTFTKTFPDMGHMGTRARILVQNRKIYVIVSYWPAGKPALAKDGDRFVESFRFTGPGERPLAALQDAGMSQNLGTADGTGWYTFHSQRHALTVSAPGQFSELESQLPDHAGRMYMLGTFALPARIKFLTTCITEGSQVVTRDGFLAKLDGISARRDRMVQGREAVEIESATEHMLAVFEPGRICMLAVEPYSKTAPAPAADVRRFFDSLVFDPSGGDAGR